MFGIFSAEIHTLCNILYMHNVDLNEIGPLDKI
jgi:hypothetical protein